MLESFDVVMLVTMGVVACLYASVGHGGASGYLAVMALFAVPVANMRVTALMLNVAVAALSFSHYYRKGHFNWKLFYPFACASIPAAVLGSMVVLNPIMFKRLLGVVLLVPIIRFLGVSLPWKAPAIPFNMVIGLIFGGAIGFLSGVLGIGGGILLSPVILLFQWGGMKETAAVTALFTFVNSLAALLNLQQSLVVTAELSVLLLIVLAGGWIGSWWGSGPAKDLWIKNALVLVLGIASWKLLVV